MKELLCRDMGNECDEVIIGADIEEVMQKTLSHLANRHPDTELSEAAQTEVKLLISDT